MNNLETIKDLMPTSQIKFDSPVKIKATPHSEVITIHEVFKTSTGLVYVRLRDGIFNELKEDSRNFENTANSLIQRLKLMSNVK